jgi:hypothetical protein
VNYKPVFEEIIVDFYYYNTNPTTLHKQLISNKLDLINNSNPNLVDIYKDYFESTKNPKIATSILNKWNKFKNIDHLSFLNFLISEIKEQQFSNSVATNLNQYLLNTEFKLNCRVKNLFLHTCAHFTGLNKESFSFKNAISIICDLLILEILDENAKDYLNLYNLLEVYLNKLIFNINFNKKYNYDKSKTINVLMGIKLISYAIDVLKYRKQSNFFTKLSLRELYFMKNVIPVKIIAKPDIESKVITLAINKGFQLELLKQIYQFKFQLV